MDSLIHNIPKAELHVHIEGTLEPELMFKIAAQNGLRLPFESVAEVRRAYDFKDLQSFLDIYYQATQILCKEEDFYQMTMAYLHKAVEQNVRHTEIFFDPQTHLVRGIKFETVVQGIHRALEDAKQNLGISSKLIMCFLRHLSVAKAMETLKEALPFKEWITAVGLDSSEKGFPPDKFGPVFDEARRNGFKAVAHAGEEGPPEYIWLALKHLKVQRIDHGICCVEDASLVKYLVEKQIPLTVCPLSNVKLQIFDDMKHHNLKLMLDQGLCATVNSDDPAYFGGYIEENFRALQEAQGLDFQNIYQLAHNSFQASFLNPVEKNKYLKELKEFVSNFGVQ